MYQFAIMYLNLNSEEFFKLTLKEYNLLVEVYQEKHKNDLEMLKDVIAVGYAQAHSKKRLKLFEEDNKVKHITLEEREEELKAIREMFETI